MSLAKSIFGWLPVVCAPVKPVARKLVAGLS